MRGRAVLLTVLATLVAAPAAGAQQPRIVNGHQASSTTYAVALAEAGAPVPEGAFCSGALIAPNVVLTAAHCTEGMRPDELDVVAPKQDGQFQRLTSDPAYRTSAAEIAVHPLADVPQFRNDVSVVRLATNLPGPVMALVPTSDTTPNDAGYLEPGDYLSVYGYGAYDPMLAMSGTLRVANMNIWADGDCALAYPGTFRALDMLCGIGRADGADACLGDSGGPAFNQTGNPGRIAGVVSWGAGCGDPDFPTVYARMANPLLGNFARALIDASPANDAAYWQPYGLVRPLLAGDLDPGGTVRCDRGTWANAPTLFRYAFVSGDAEPQFTSSDSYVVRAADAGRPLRCVVKALRDGAGGYGLAASEALLAGSGPGTTDPPAQPPVDPGPGTDARTGGAPSTGTPSAPAERTADTPAAPTPERVAVTAPSRQNVLAVSVATRSCRAGACTIELRIRPRAKVRTLKAALLRCATLACTKGRRTKVVPRRGSDGVFRVKLSRLKAGTYALILTAPGRRTERSTLRLR